MTFVTIKIVEIPGATAEERRSYFCGAAASSPIIVTSHEEVMVNVMTNPVEQISPKQLEKADRDLSYLGIGFQFQAS
ncbi:hypothetical protein [Cohnella sp. GCM10027633]|uniref:hypothetical protein n=1 Tax=unclassified Cohnella TaxID=2636738 RepID=UPI003633E83A